MTYKVTPLRCYWVMRVEEVKDYWPCYNGLKINSYQALTSWLRWISLSYSCPVKSLKPYFIVVSVMYVWWKEISYTKILFGQKISINKDKILKNIFSRCETYPVIGLYNSLIPHSYVKMTWHIDEECEDNNVTHFRFNVSYLH